MYVQFENFIINLATLTSIKGGRDGSATLEMVSGTRFKINKTEAGKLYKFMSDLASNKQISVYVIS